MTLNELYVKGKNALSDAKIEGAQVAADMIFEQVFGMGRIERIKNGGVAADERSLLFESKINDRLTGIPLQYILGGWEFCGLRFAVDSSVLIPREETALLCDTVLENASEKAVILDLCSGSGAVGVTLAKKLPHSRVVCAELSDEAIITLKKNIEINSAENAEALRLDVLGDWEKLPEADIIAANPPYIATRDLDSLQTEVRFEPKMALDGGEDGLLFYRAIAEKSPRKLKPGGLLSVEIGYNQAAAVSALFAQSGFKNITVLKDINWCDRVMIANMV